MQVRLLPLRQRLVSSLPRFEPSLYCVYNLPVDLIDGEVAVDYDDTHRLARGDLKIFVMNTAKEGVLFAFKAALIFASFSGLSRVAAPRADERGLHIRQEENSEIGLQVIANNLMELANDI